MTWRVLLGGSIALIICAMMLYACAARAHDSAHPEHTIWLKSLHNNQGTPCCDESEALRLENVDWQTTCEKGTGECHFQVFIEKRWWNVPETAVVKNGNLAGATLVWPILYWIDGDPKKGISSVSIRCFLPGAGG